MTRINVVPVTELCDQHLLAEHRELTRIPNGILSGKLQVHYDDRPTQYTLGKGHVKFFTNKLNWLWDRYQSITRECDARGFFVLYKWPICPTDSDCYFGVIEQPNGDEYDREYLVTEEDLALNRARIQERWPKNARYYGVPM